MSNDGGPAFPHTIDSGGPAGCTTYHGMTLRDYLAGQFLAGVAAQEDGPLIQEEGQTPQDALSEHWGGVAKAAYIASDAMLAAREEKPHE